MAAACWEAAGQLPSSRTPHSAPTTRMATCLCCCRHGGRRMSTGHPGSPGRYQVGAESPGSGMCARWAAIMRVAHRWRLLCLTAVGTVCDDHRLCKRRAKRTRSEEQVLPRGTTVTGKSHSPPHHHLDRQRGTTMQYLRIAGAALLTGVGLGSLAASSVLWRQAGIDIAPIVSRALNVRS